MDAVINISTEEFNQDFFDNIKALFNHYKKGIVSISISYADTSPDESAEQYEKRLLSSIKQLQEGKTIKFTEENFKLFAENLLTK